MRNFQTFKRVRYFLGNDGYFRSSNGDMLHRAVWESKHGKMPRRHEVHHKDRDKSNNRLDNLELLSPSDHARRHALERFASDPESMREHMRKHVLPAAHRWWKSPEGRARMAEVWAARPKSEFRCIQCGETYMGYSHMARLRLCSNTCRSRYRYASGVDDEPRHCAACGTSFVVNKHSTRRFCSGECGSSKPAAHRNDINQLS